MGLLASRASSYFQMQEFSREKEKFARILVKFFCSPTHSLPVMIPGLLCVLNWAVPLLGSSVHLANLMLCARCFLPGAAGAQARE